MISTIFFMYVFTIPLIVTALVIYVLSIKDNTEIKNSHYFLFWVFTLSAVVCDMFLYYTDIVKGNICNMAIAATMLVTSAAAAFLWMCIINDVYNSAMFKALKYAMALGAVTYAGVQIAYAYNERYIAAVIVSEVFIALLYMISLIGIGIIESKKESPRIQTLCITTIAFLIMMSIGSDVFGDVYYIWRTGYYIVIWLIISLLNLAYLVYSLQIKESRESHESNYAGQSIKKLGEKYNLTIREQEIMKEIYEGAANSQIAEKLIISEGTVKFHVHNILTKMNLNSRVAIISEIQRTR